MGFSHKVDHFVREVDGAPTPGSVSVINNTVPVTMRNFIEGRDLVNHKDAEHPAIFIHRQHVYSISDRGYNGQKKNLPDENLFLTLFRYAVAVNRAAVTK